LYVKFNYLFIYT